MTCNLIAYLLSAYILALVRVSNAWDGNVDEVGLLIDPSPSIAAYPLPSPSQQYYNYRPNYRISTGNKQF